MGRRKSKTYCGDFGGKTEAGKPCRHYAGHGTDHPGEGLCRAHEEVTTRRKAREAGLRIIEGGLERRSPPDEKCPLPCPDFLPERAAKLWETLAYRLDELGQLEDIDESALLGLCVSYHMMLMAAATLMVEGINTTDPAHKDRVRKHPAWQQWREADANFRQWCQKFQITPAARKGLDMPDDGAQEDPLEQLLRKAARR